MKLFFQLQLALATFFNGYFLIRIAWWMLGIWPIAGEDGGKLVVSLCIGCIAAMVAACVWDELRKVKP